MNTGDKCPKCGAELWLMSTHNRWKLYCKTCDQRYNCGLQPMPPVESPEWKP